MGRARLCVLTHCISMSTSDTSSRKRARDDIEAGISVDAQEPATEGRLKSHRWISRGKCCLIAPLAIPANLLRRLICPTQCRPRPDGGYDSAEMRPDGRQSIYTLFITGQFFPLDQMFFLMCGITPYGILWLLGLYLWQTAGRRAKRMPGHGVSPLHAGRQTGGLADSRGSAARRPRM